MVIKMQSKTEKLVIVALMASLVCVVTMIIKIPSPLNGYINLGDGIVLVCGWVLSPLCGFLAAGIGSALADVISGYFVYAPITFIIKGAMALIAHFVHKLMRKSIGKLPAQLIGGTLAEILMALGYFVYEGMLYGFTPSLTNMPANAIQGAVGLVIGVVLINLLERAHITPQK